MPLWKGELSRPCEQRLSIEYPHHKIRLAEVHMPRRRNEDGSDLVIEVIVPSQFHVAVLPSEYIW